MAYVFDHANGYRALLEQLKSNRKRLPGRSVRRFIAISGFQFDMQSRVENKVLEPIKEIHELCGVNLEYGIYAMRCLKYGSYHVTANIVRPIYESIPKMFYLLRQTQDIPYVMLSEAYKSWRGWSPKYSETLVDKFLKDVYDIKADDHRNIIPEAARSTFKKNASKREKFGPAWYRRQVYNKELRKKRARFYSLLSVSAHSNFVRGYGTPRPRIIEKYPEFVTQLSFFNLFLNANAIAQTLTNIGEFDDAKKFILETYGKLGGLLPGSDLYPDKTTYTKRLKIKLPSK